MERNDVLIVGGGGAGLSAAVMLADMGVDALLIERHPGTTILPKAHILNPRTMEIFDLHGMADRVYAQGTPMENLKSATWYTSLGGSEAWSRQAFYSTSAWGGGDLAERYAEATGMVSGNLPQLMLEPLLLDEASRRAPGRQLFNHELISLVQDADGVTSTVRDRTSGETMTVRSQYLIAADGGRTVGPLLEIGMEGPQPFVHMISIHFAADLSAYLQEDSSIIRMINRPTVDGGWVRGGCIAMGPTRWDRTSEEWRVSVTLPVGATHPSEYDAERAIADIRRQLDISDLEIEVKVISFWLIESVVAERYQRGRVFLVGDAAHRHAPMGGLGLNTGVQDVHNLSWKLAHVVHGSANPALLDSYEPERRPVGQRNVEWATFNFFNHLAAGSGFGMLAGAPDSHNRAALEALFADTPDGANRRSRLQDFYWAVRREFQQLDMELGFEYSQSPAVVSDGSAAPPRDPVGTDYRQTSRPGHRMPHAELSRDGAVTSTHRLLRPARYLVLAGPVGEPWRSSVKRFVERTGFEIDFFTVGGREADLHDSTGAWASLRGHDEAGLVVVRPDGHVGWRSNGGPESDSTFTSIMAALVGGRVPVIA